MYIETQEDLLELVAKLEGSKILAIDTEFLREKTYFAKLCLIQINNGMVQAIIDPLAKGIDLHVLAPILTDVKCTKIFHAGSQDIEILYYATGVTPTPVFDTQIAASLMGHPSQMGYGPLVLAMCDVKLAKADSYTDWSRRPLSKSQLKYALDDVVYLPQIYDMMVDELTKNGRLEWLDRDFKNMADPSHYENRPREMWHRVKRISSLSRAQLAIAREVAAWREEEAMRRDLPRKWIIPDEAVVDISRKAPKTAERLLEVRGLADRLNRRAISQLLECVRRAKEMPQEQWPKIDKKPRGNDEVEGAIDMMAALVKLRAHQNGVTVPLLASRDELNRVAHGDREGVEVLEGWRYEMVGAELLGLLSGEKALYLHKGSIKVTDRHHV